jgi:thiamine-phosphate pyrophosphorylase
MLGLCVISDEGRAGDLKLVGEALAGGADMIQLRHKSASDAALKVLAIKVRGLTAAAGRRLIINDRLNVALDVDADGVHLGEADLPVKTARRLAGARLIIGASAGTVDTALAAQAAGADYIGVGPVYPTASKIDARPVIGLEHLLSICRAVRVPVIAIGGIDDSRVPAVMAAGAAGVAVISAVAGALDPRAATARIKELIDVSTASSGSPS